MPSYRLQPVLKIVHDETKRVYPSLVSTRRFLLEIHRWTILPRFPAIKDSIKSGASFSRKCHKCYRLRPSLIAWFPAGARDDASRVSRPRCIAIFALRAWSRRARWFSSIARHVESDAHICIPSPTKRPFRPRPVVSNDGKREHAQQQTRFSSRCAASHSVTRPRGSLPALITSLSLPER